MLALLAITTACAGGGQEAADSAIVADTAAAVTDSAAARDSVIAFTALDSARAPLSPLADSIAQRLVFAPVTQRTLVAAVRGTRLLMDIGRVDTEVRRDSARARAYRQAVAARSPFPSGMRVRLRGPWGSDDATVTGFDTWNGRIVATLRATPALDSLAATGDPLTALAERTTETRAGEPRACDATAADPALLARAKVVGDSLLRAMEQADTVKGNAPPARFASQLRTRATSVAGCFGPGRMVLAATRWGGASEWVRERVVLLDAAGVATPLTVADLRFRAHELLAAFDADGDGTDDVAARATGDRVGGTVILRLVGGARLERLAAGFAWESR